MSAVGSSVSEGGGQSAIPVLHLGRLAIGDENERTKPYKLIY